MRVHNNSEKSRMDEKYLDRVKNEMDMRNNKAQTEKRKEVQYHDGVRCKAKRHWLIHVINGERGYW